MYCSKLVNVRQGINRA